MPNPVGMIEGLTQTVGGATNDLGGRNQTRLTAAVAEATAIVAVYTWNSTTTVTTGDTSEVSVGEFIRLDSDGQFFEIGAITPNVDITLLNPDSLVIPTGAGTSSKAITSVSVETTVDWPASGKIGIEGTPYRYASKTNTTFDGLTYALGALRVAGVRKAHRIQSTVLDLSQNRSSMDFLRQAFLVDFAVEDDLNALGRNLNVLRRPFVGDDDQFRDIIKALAYNPRGTLLGLRLALDALLGVGNYTIYEDLIGFPNTVFINATAAAPNNISAGKAFLAIIEADDATSNTTVDISATPIAVGSVRWKDENHFTDTRTAKPSADSIIDYVGDAGTTLWSFIGTNEATQITVVTADGGATEFGTTNSAMYEHLMRIQPESNAALSMTAKLATGVTWGTASQRVIVMGIHDTNSQVGVGFADNTATTFDVGLVDLVAGTFITGAAATLLKGVYHNFTIKKFGQDRVELYANGGLIETEPYASFPATTDHQVEFGYPINPPTSPDLRVRGVGYFARTNTDYWNSRGTGGDVNSANPRELDVNIVSHFVGGDVGKTVFIRNSSVTNPQNGNNNGRYIIESVDTDEIVTLRGEDKKNATVVSAFPLRITISGQPNAFKFPDDLGKTIVMSGATNPANNGSFTIDKLLQAGTLVDLESFASTIPETTNVCEVTVAAFITEPGIDWRLDPAFATEASVEWEMSDAGSFAGTTLTLRQALPITTGGYTRVLDVLFTDVLSAQLMEDNEILTDTFYPFYLADPLGFLQPYLDELTAAGVIPEITFE